MPDHTTTTNVKDIAVIGMDCRFPGAGNILQFWNNIREGRESINFYSRQEIIDSGVDPHLADNPAYVYSDGGQVKGKYNFDASFFHYTVDEAMLMDPQTRLMHECIYNALLDAGCPPGVTQAPIGLFAGASGNPLWQILCNLSDIPARIGSWGANHFMSKDFGPSLTAHKLGLNGPVMSMDTACSTSLVALHMALNSLYLGQCQVAVAGGVSLSVGRRKGYLYQEGYINSPDGHCRAFDQQAKGIVSGEGAGMVVLKPLDLAIKDGDYIYAVIKGSAINNDGNRKPGFTAPSLQGQVAVVQEALATAGISPEEVGFLETHGTGTSLGDHIEIEALKKAFNTDKRNYCFLGATKTNFGHLDVAAGIAGFMKAVLVVNHRIIPPVVNFDTPNPLLRLDTSPFVISKESIAWPAKMPVFAGVSSFGIGGTNAHVVLKGYQPEKHVEAPAEEHLLVLSARHAPVLEAMQESLKTFLQHHPDTDLPALAHTLQAGRETMAVKCAGIFHTRAEMLALLENNQLKQAVTETKERKVIFAFPGQGMQYAGMGAELYKREGVFREVMQQCFKLLETLTGKDFEKILYPDEESDSSLINQTVNSQPLLFIFEYALAQQVIAWGWQPHSMIGHSIGEYVAACMAGVMTLPQALRLVVKRGELMQAMEPGDMLAIRAGWKEVLKHLPSSLSFASVNSPGHCVISGAAAVIKDTAGKLAGHNFASQLLNTSHAFHSPMMKGAAEAFAAAFADEQFGTPQVPFISNVTGSFITGQDGCNIQYWAGHLRNTVQLDKGLSQLLKNQDALILELGPGNSLSSFIRENENYTPAHILVSLIKPVNNKTVGDWHYMLQGIRQMWLQGIPVHWNQLYPAPRKKIPLPGYPFVAQEFKIDPVLLDEFLENRAPIGRTKPASWWYLPTWRRSLLPVLTGPPNGKWLVIGDNRQLVTELVTRLQQPGVAVYHLLLDKVETYAANSHQFIINKDNPEHYAAVLKHFNTDTTALTLVDTTGWDAPDAGHWQLFKQWMFLAKALSVLTSPEKICLCSITTGNYNVTGNEQVTRAVAALPGILPVMAQEYFQLKAVNIDLPVNATLQNYYDAIYHECIASDPDHLVCLRSGNIRWLPVYENITTTQPATTRAVKEGGNYLITGGLGQIGFLLAQHIHEKKGRVVVIGRTPLANAGKRWEQLQQTVPGIQYLHADVTDLHAFRKVVADFITAQGPVAGVFHLAAQRPDISKHLITHLTPDAGEALMRAKICGAENIYQIFEDKQPDFVVLFSSVAGLLGGVGYFAYAAANAYLDRLAELYDNPQGTRWTALDWDAWQTGEQDKLPANSIGTGDAAAVFDAMMAVPPYPRLIISVNNLNARIDKWVKKQTPAEKELPLALPKLERTQQAAVVLPSAGPEAILLELWQELFGYDVISVEDNFFELGGDSLKALNLVNLIRKKFAVDISLSDFFKHATISGIASLLFAGESEVAPLLPATGSEQHLLSSAQKRLFILHEMEPESLAYNMPKAIRIKGKADYDALEKAFIKLIHRHEILRTSIQIKNEEPVQVISANVHFSIIRYQATESEIPVIIRQFIAPFNLRNPPLLRVGMISLVPEESILLIDMHHIVTDGVSQGLLIRDFMALYRGESLPPLSLHYKDYALWQQSTGHQQKIAQQKAFWMELYRDVPESLQLPCDFKRPARKSYSGSNVYFELPAAGTLALKKIADTSGLTLFTLLLAAYNVLLGKLGNTEDVVVGTPMLGRQHPDTADMTGMFVNTLAVRNRPAGSLHFREFLETVKHGVLAAFDNQEFQYEDLVDALKLERNTGHNALFDVVFVYDSFEPVSLSIPGLELSSIATTQETAKFDLILSVAETPAGLMMGFEYATDLFKESTVIQFGHWFKNILTAIIQQPDVRIDELQWLSDGEITALVHASDYTGVAYPATATLHALFAAAAARYPDRTALVLNEETLSYQALETQSNILANRLKLAGVGRNDVVGLLTGRSTAMITGMLGILKAGACYLPIDTEYPEDRIRFMLEDSGAVLLLTEEEGHNAYHRNCMFIGSTEAHSNAVAPVNHNEPGDLAYIIYTSGTTGRPKGVMITHENVVRLFFNDQPLFGFTAEDVWTMFHNQYFDFSVWEMYGALLFGGKLVIVPKATARDPQAFLDLLRSERVTILNQTPAAFYNLADAALLQAPSPLHLRYIIFGGEALQPARLQGWYERYPRVRLINMFGITETTVHVTYKEIGIHEINTNISNIGRPIPTLSVVLLDASGHVVPNGVVGELYVGGAGVARGYLNRDELTTARFVQHPYIPAQRLYRSGDLARRLENGELEYIGRMDHQVKIRGFRIELGEIASCLLLHPQVKDAVVIARKEEQHTFLCAYIVFHPGFADKDAVRASLAERLPDYMLPAYIISMEAIPQTVNGKTDKSRLPAPEATEEAPEASDVDAGGDAMYDLWKTVLKCGNVTAASNFFALGGDSMIAIRLINQVNKTFGIKARVTDLFLHQAAGAFAKHVISLQPRSETTAAMEAIEKRIAAGAAALLVRYPELDPATIEMAYPASDIQKGMIYHAMKDAGMYHDQMVHYLQYPDEWIALFPQAVELLAEKHAILRTAFLQEEDNLWQVVYKKISRSYDYQDLSSLAPTAQQAVIRNSLQDDRQQPFRLEQPGLFRYKIFKLDAEQYCICFICHHAIIDGWSDASLNTELHNTLAALATDADFKPQPLQSTYLDFVKARLVDAENPLLRQYWKDTLTGYKRFTFDETTTPGIFRRDTFELTKPQLQALKQQAGRLQVSLRSLFFGAFLAALKCFSYDDDLTVGIVVNNRLETEDGDKVLGCFLNTIPFRVTVPFQQSWFTFITAIHEKLSRQRGYEGVPFMDIVQSLNAGRGAGNPITDVLFNFTDFHIYDSLTPLPPLQPASAPEGGDVSHQLRNNSLFNLDVNVTGHSCALALSYVTGFAATEVAKAFLAALQRALIEIGEQTDSVFGTGILTGSATQPLLPESLNATDKAYDADTIPGLFAAQAARTPHANAVVFEEQLLDYATLHKHSSILAAYLTEIVPTGTVIPIYLERSVNLLVVLLGVLKAGCAYVPLDPKHPKNRTRLILDDLQAPLLLVGNDTAAHEVVMETGIRIINVDQLPEHISGATSSLPVCTPATTAYVMYTSGTTGRPKGVEITHGSLHNFIRAMQELLGADEEMVMLSVTTYSFDISGLEYYLPLCFGGCVDIASAAALTDPALLIARIRDIRPTHLQSTPSRWQQLLDAGWTNETSLHILTGGEAITETLKDRLLGISQYPVWNLYGPTETTIWSSACKLKAGQPVTVGRPIANTRFFVLDKNKQPLPSLVNGDLYISGAGLAAGYYQKPDLTAECFIENPFKQPGHLLLYKTGDRARWLLSGDVALSGRTDNQVKIRGYRVELGEIEGVLAACPAIREAAVTYRQDLPQPVLAAYYVADKGVDRPSIRQYMAARLPDYMVPSCFVEMEKLPVNASGKIDRAALPEPISPEIAPVAAPTTETERAIAAIWAAVLEVPAEKLGINDSFYDLGGHSLNAPVLVRRIQRQLNIRIAIIDFLAMPTVRELAAHIDGQLLSGQAVR